MKERIKEIIEAESLNSSKFAEVIGVQKSSISHILSGRNKPSLDIVLKVLRQFRTISSEWLLFGTGEMYKTAGTGSTTKKILEQKKLFEELAEEVEVREETRTSETKTHQPEEEKIQETVKPKQEINVQQTQNPVSQIQTKSDDGVDKIVIFFSNRTFKDYSPA